MCVFCGDVWVVLDWLVGGVLEFGVFVLVGIWCMVCIGCFGDFVL